MPHFQFLLVGIIVLCCRTGFRQNLENLEKWYFLKILREIFFVVELYSGEKISKSGHFSEKNALKKTKNSGKLRENLF